MQRRSKRKVEMYSDEWFKRLIEIHVPPARTIQELVEDTRYFFRDPVYDEKAIREVLLNAPNPAKTDK